MIPRIINYGPKSRKWRKRTYKKRLRRILKHPEWGVQILLGWSAFVATHEIQGEEDLRGFEALEASVAGC